MTIPTIAPAGNGLLHPVTFWQHGSIELFLLQYWHAILSLPTPNPIFHLPKFSFFSCYKKIRAQDIFS